MNGRLSGTPQQPILNCEHNEKPKEDLTGRDRLVPNVIFSWSSHFVFIIAGFIMPRMIDHRLGQELLGVWDFAWSLVSYFSLVQAGVGSSVNRYVAKHRAAGDTIGMNRIVSSASCVLFIAGLIVFIVTITVSLILPLLFGAKLGEKIQQAQWVVFFLGISIALEISFGVFNGILTGCHRWGLHNLTKSGYHIITITGMIVALLKGGGLRSLAVVNFAGQVLENTTRMILAHRVCEGLRIRLSLIRWEAIRKLFVFGGKTLIPSISNMLLNQTTSILIVAYLGPAALALYSRPRSLVLHMNTLVSKMAMTLTPTVSSLQSINNFKEIRELLITSVRYSFYMVLPIALVLIVFGDAVMHFWMGQRYANVLLPAILSAGFLAVLVQVPAINILAGLNAHGRAGIARFIASVFSVVLTIFVLGYLKGGLTSTAIAVTLPMTIMYIFYLPILVCRKVGIDVERYFLSVIVGPSVHVLPFAFCLVTARFIFSDAPLKGLFWGGLTGGIVLAILYYRYVIPKGIKIRIFRSKTATA